MGGLAGLISRAYGTNVVLWAWKPTMGEKTQYGRDCGINNKWSRVVRRLFIVVKRDQNHRHAPKRLANELRVQQSPNFPKHQSQPSHTPCLGRVVVDFLLETAHRGLRRETSNHRRARP